MTPPIFRPGQRRDAPRLAELMRLADRAHYDNYGFDISLGTDPDRQLRLLCQLAEAEPPSWFHYSHFEVAEVDGTVVASASGFDRNTADNHVEEALRSIGWTDQQLADLNERIAPIYEIYPPDPPGSWVIDHVAVLPEWRGHGLARVLLERVIERGRAAGATLLHLEVFDGNSSAQRLYESLGFRIEVTFGRQLFGDLLGRGPMHRMVRPMP
jgi:ribosomal protein S18 acetylase RimI-like enzyme